MLETQRREVIPLKYLTKDTCPICYARKIVDRRWCITCTKELASLRELNTGLLKAEEMRARVRLKRVIAAQSGL